MVSLYDLYKVVEDNPLSSGITFSGGEPFLYAPQLAVLAQAVHALGKDVWAFSGWTYEWLAQSEHAKALLDNVDVLVDGPFLLAERDLTLKFRGSRNQRVIDLNTTRKTGCLTELYSLRQMAG